MGVPTSSVPVGLFLQGKLKVSVWTDCAEPECFRPHATPIEVSKFQGGLLSRYLAKLSVSPFKASGAFKALRGRNPTWAKREGPARSTTNVWASRDYSGKTSARVVDRSLTRLTVADRRLTSRKSSNNF